MSTSSTAVDRASVVRGAISGVVAWILGYVLTFVAVGQDVQDSSVNRFIEAVQGEPATYEMVGWVFYNAHFVDTIYTNVPFVGSFTTNVVGSDDGFSVLLYLIPVGLLVAGGLAMGQYHNIDDPMDGMTAGVTLVPGYLLLTIVGLFLFEVSAGGATAAPKFAEGIVIAGLVFPAIFGAIGGFLATLT